MNHQMEFKIINCHINLSAIELMAFNLYEFVTLLTSLFDNYDFFSLQEFLFFILYFLIL